MAFFFFQKENFMTYSKKCQDFYSYLNDYFKLYNLVKKLNICQLDFGCANYNYKSGIINIDIEKITKVIDSQSNLIDILIERVLLHEFRHAMQRRLVICNGDGYINELYYISFENNNISSICLPTETNANLFSLVYSLKMMLDNNVAEENAYQQLKKIILFLEKTYAHDIPTKEFFILLDDVKTYYYFLNRINNEYRMTLNGLNLDEKIYNTFLSSLYNPYKLKKILTRDIFDL